MITEQLIRLSGANRDVLEQCPSERPKFVGVGGAVLTTAVLAAAAATFTVHSFLGIALPFAIAIALGWGIAILNLDRWLVASTKRQDNPLANLGLAAPRIALAFVIGLVIAEPIVLKVFSAEIDVEVVRLQQEEIAAQRAQQARDYERLDVLRKRAAELEGTLTMVSTNEALLKDPKHQELTKELESLRGRLDTAEKAVICEKEGTCGSGKAGAGPAYAEKVRLRDELARQVVAKEQERARLESELGSRQQGALASLRPQQQADLDAVRKEIDTLEAERLANAEEFRKERKDAAGLLDRMQALSSLGERNAAAASAHTVLRIFILVLDSLPVLIKLFMSLGKPSLYDQSLEQYETAALASSDEAYKRQAEARSIGASLIIDEANIRHDLELDVVRQLTGEIVAVQREVAEAYIAAWKEEALRNSHEEVASRRLAFVDAVPNGNGKTDHPLRPGEMRKNPNFRI